MKNLFAIFILAISVNGARATEIDTNGLTWYTNLDTVVTLSNESKKPIFGFFTGSDWCGWCIKLQREVFAKKAFVEWALANVILFEIDFPRNTPQPAELKTQNQNLQRAFAVAGYPTIHVFTAVKDATSQNFSLTPWGQLGYPGGAVKGQEEVKFLENANAVLAKDPTKAK